MPHFRAYKKGDEVSLTALNFCAAVSDTGLVTSYRFPETGQQVR